MPTIRPVQASDVVALVPLLSTLGYPSTADQLFRRITRLLSDPAYQAWVSLLDGAVVGFAAGHLLHTIESDTPGAQLIVLVSAEHCRGRGVGSALCAEFERWAVTGGATRAVLGSALHRKDAHGFYERRGYAPGGLRFGKQLGRDHQQ